MSFDWQQYYHFAQELLGNLGRFSSGDEALMRSVMSRAYYGAFKVSYNYLRDYENIPGPFDGNAHWFLIREFKNRYDERHKNVGLNLERLRKLRNLADYEDNLYTPLNRAKLALLFSNEILQELELFKNGK